MKRLHIRLPAWWPVFWPAALIIAGAAVMLLHQLASLAPRLSPTEQTSVSLTHHLPDLLAGSAPIPLRLLEWASLHMPLLNQILLARLPSVVIGLMSLTALAYITQRWYAQRSMVFGLLLVASSAWFLHISRFAGLEIEYFAATPALLAAHLLLYDYEDSVTAWLVWLAVNTLLLFVPGLGWFVVLSAVWQWRTLLHAIAGLAIWQRIVSALPPLAAIGWLAYDVMLHHNLLLPIVGLPNNVSAALRALPQNLLHTLELFVYNGPDRPELWLGRLPLLDVLIVISFAAGVFFYARHPLAKRTQLLASYLILSVLLISLGSVGVSVAMPLIYLIAVAGIAYVLHFWLRIFPHNPLARSFGIGIMALLIALSCYYNLTQYFVAWPHNPAVVQVYRSNH